VTCKICGKCKPYVFANRGTYKCKTTRKEYSDQSLSEFRYSKLSKDKQKLLVEGRAAGLGPSALARHAGVDYKTGWRFLNKHKKRG